MERPHVIFRETDQKCMCPQRNGQLPGSRASWNRSTDVGGWGARPASLQEKESVGAQQRWGKNEDKLERTHSGYDEGGSAANRVKIVAINNWITYVEGVTRNTHCVTIVVFFFLENKSFGAQHVHRSSVNTLMTLHAEQNIIKIHVGHQSVSSLPLSSGQTLVRTGSLSAIQWQPQGAIPSKILSMFQIHFRYTVSAKKLAHSSKIIRFFKSQPMRAPDDFRSVFKLCSWVWVSSIVSKDQISNYFINKPVEIFSTDLKKKFSFSNAKTALIC